MAKGKDKTGEEAARPADSGRASDAPLSEEISALFAGPAAAFAAMTAIGFGVATQMTNAFVSALQTSNRTPAAEPAASPAPVPTKVEAQEPAAEEAPAPVASEPAPAVVSSPVEQPVETVALIVKTGDVAAPAKRGSGRQPKAKSEAVVTPMKELVAKAEAAARPKAKVAKSAAAPKVVEPEAGTPEVTRSKPATTRTTKRGKNDDLKKISGIGPKLEQLLNDKGVKRYADIARWGEADITRFDAELGVSGRIERDDWVGQAKALTGGKG